ncbi:MAG: glycosyltransferase family 2 protein [Halioglobus sp.]|nr:glycosyltransferase family 2 protein [Halioglobus sp.]
MQTASRLSVSIVLHNSAQELLQKTLSSLDRAAALALSEGLLDGVAVVLIDNASAGAYLDQLKAQVAGLPLGSLELAWLPQRDNRGFGAGHNLALAQVHSDYHLVLNPDVELATDALCAGLRALDGRADVALLCPGATGSDGAPAYLCKRYPSLLVLLLRGFAPRFLQRLFKGALERYQVRDIIDAGEPAEVEIASGCFMLLRTPDLAALGGFDEGYFLYFEDFDLSLRLREQGRGALLYWPEMRIVHHGGDAARKGLDHVRYFLRSARRFFGTHGWRFL